MTVEIPDKSYFKIGEVSRIVGVEPYNIRYWESQFKVVKPAKTKSRQRLYRRGDIEILLRIKHLLYDEGYTIAGAKKRLKAILDGTDDEDVAGATQPSLLTDEERRAYDERLSESQAELQELRTEATTLREELEHLRAEHRAQLELYDADRQALVEQLGSVSRAGDDDALHARIAELETENAKLRRELERMPAELSATRARLAAQTERANALARDVAQAERQQRLLTEAIRAELRPLLGRQPASDEA